MKTLIAATKRRAGGRRSISGARERKTKCGSLLKAGVEEAAAVTSLPTRMSPNSVKTLIQFIHLAESEHFHT